MIVWGPELIGWVLFINGERGKDNQGRGKFVILVIRVERRVEEASYGRVHLKILVLLPTKAGPPPPPL